jgi:hypothetical protein
VYEEGGEVKLETCFRFGELEIAFLGPSTVVSPTTDIVFWMRQLDFLGESRISSPSLVVFIIVVVLNDQHIR